MLGLSGLDTFRGLPVHVLVLHLTVVLVPVVSVTTAAVAWRPSRRWGTALAVVLVDVVTVGLVVVTKESGEALQRRLPPSPAIERHAASGDSLVWFVVALVLAAVLVLMTTGRAGVQQDGPVSLARRRRARTTPATLLVGAATTAVAIATVVWVVRVGEAGAGAAWRAVVLSTTT